MRRTQIDMYRERCSTAVVLVMKMITDAPPTVDLALTCERATRARRQVGSRL
jgi:hypothetical protein